MFNIEEQVGKPAWNNCMTWALYHWFRYGGYLVLRRAKSWIPYPHFLWRPPHCDDIYHFVPYRNIQLPYPIFKGTVKKDDWTEDSYNDWYDRN